MNDEAQHRRFRPSTMHLVVPPDLSHRLLHVAEHTGRNVGALIREAIETYLRPQSEADS